MGTEGNVIPFPVSSGQSWVKAPGWTEGEAEDREDAPISLPSSWAKRRVALQAQSALKYHSGWRKATTS